MAIYRSMGENRNEKENIDESKRYEYIDGVKEKQTANPRVGAVERSLPASLILIHNVIVLRRQRAQYATVYTLHRRLYRVLEKNRTSTEHSQSIIPTKQWVYCVRRRRTVCMRNKDANYFSAL